MARIIISTIDKFKSMATLHYCFHFLFFSFRFRSETFIIPSPNHLSLCTSSVLLFSTPLQCLHLFLLFVSSSASLIREVTKNREASSPPLSLSSVKSPWRLFPPWHLFFMTPLFFLCRSPWSLHPVSFLSFVTSFFIWSKLDFESDFVSGPLIECFVQENLGMLREDRKKWRRKRPRRRRQELRRIWSRSWPERRETKRIGRTLGLIWF